MVFQWFKSCQGPPGIILGSPRGSPGVPRRPQGLPGLPQGRPGTSQGSPGTFRRLTRDPQGRPMYVLGSPGAPQERPQESLGTPRDPKILTGRPYVLRSHFQQRIQNIDMLQSQLLTLNSEQLAQSSARFTCCFQVIAVAKNIETGGGGVLP